MAMRVDDARHHVHALGIQDLHAFWGFHAGSEARNLAILNKQVGLGFGAIRHGDQRGIAN